MASNVELEALGDFMELVTAYRCKFCDFTATLPQTISVHVKQTHVTSAQKVSVPKLVQYPAASSTDVHLSMPASSSQQAVSLLTGQLTAIQPNTRLQNESESQAFAAVDALSSVIEQSEICLQDDQGKQATAVEEATENQSIQIRGMPSSQTQMYNKIMEPVPSTSSVAEVLSAGSNLSVLSTSESSGLSDQLQTLTDAQGLGNIQFVNEDSQGQLVAADCGHVRLGDGSTVQVLVYDSNIAQNVDTQTSGTVNDVVDVKTQASEAGCTNHADVDTGLHFVIDAEDGVYTEQDQSQVKPGDSQSTEGKLGFSDVPSQSSTAEDDPNSKELYLCGSCCEGFSTISDCKVHMIQQHGLNDASNSGRVDTGTQMEPRKKAGRKRKSDKAQEEKEEEEQEDIVLSDTDEDWTEQMCSYSTRSQRKRRPPSSLRKDYYLGRKKQKTQKKRVDAGMNIRCEVKGCVARFRSQEGLKQHMECHIEGLADHEPQFRCTVCKEQFTLWKYTRYHLWKMHEIDVDLFTCDICNNFKTDTLSKLKIHCEIHGEERPYQCEVCGKGFKQFAQMKNHEHCHTDNSLGVDPQDVDKWHTPKDCNICGRTFANVKCMKKHRETVHSDYKPFKCSYCSHTCSRKAMMIIHQRIHTGEKPFSCDQCSYSCGDHNSLRRHKMRHSGLKPYKCPHCPYACIQAISLKVHVKNKHPGMGGIYNCHLCLYRTVNKQQYENHLKDHKNGLIETLVAADGQIMYKNVNHSRKPKVRPVKSEITTVALQPNLLESIHTQTLQMQNMLQPQVIQVPASGGGDTEQVAQLEMQVQMNEAGENVISAEDLAKLTNYDGMVHSDVQAAQLIYSALSAISQNSGANPDLVTQGLVTDVENGDIQTSIQTNSEKGVTTHTITFHLQEGEETTMQEDSGNKNVRILKLDDVGNPWPANTVFLDQAEVQNS